MSRASIAVGIPSLIVAEVDTLSDDDIVLLDHRIENGHAVLTNCRIRCILVFACIMFGRAHELLLPTRCDVAMLFVLVHRVVETAHKSTPNRSLVHDDRVLLVVSAVARNRNNRVHTIRHLVHLQNVHRTRLDERTRQ